MTVPINIPEAPQGNDTANPTPNTKPTEHEDISLCNACGCMTHTINSRCGKCKAEKPTEPIDDKLREKVLTTIEDRFVHTLDLRPDKDVPALADDIVELITADRKQLLDRVHREDIGHLYAVGDKLAAAAALVCSEYDGIHRLRAALSEWYDLRAGIHSTKLRKDLGL